MSATKSLVQQAKDLRLKKGLSQNFLINGAILQAIASAAAQSDPSLPLAEIGAGAGFLTRELLKTHQQVYAIEIDLKMADYLTQLYGHCSNLQILQQDVRKVDLTTLLVPRGTIVGNIPYHLTGPILFQIAGELADPHYPLRQQLIQVLLMVQKEVADRLLAKPGSQAYGQLTLQIQCWFDVQPVVSVPKTAFYPAPKVDSMVVQLLPRAHPAVTPKDFAFLSRVIKASFVHRRKTLYNNLKLAGLGTEDRLKALLAQQQLLPTIRPQELTLAQYGALADALFLQHSSPRQD